MGLREIILAGDKTLQKVPLPQLGVTAYVGALSVAKVIELRQLPKDQSGCAIVAESVRDEHGAPLFTEKDVEALSKSDFPTINTLYLAAMKKNDLLDEDEEDEAVKNSEPTTSSDSTAT
jgi:hypothetical protein